MTAQFSLDREKGSLLPEGTRRGRSREAVGYSRKLCPIRNQRRRVPQVQVKINETKSVKNLSGIKSSELHLRCQRRDFPDGPGAKAPSSQCRPAGWTSG